MATSTLVFSAPASTASRKPTTSVTPLTRRLPHSHQALTLRQPIQTHNLARQLRGTKPSHLTVANAATAEAPSAPEYEEVGDGRALAIEIAKEVDMLKGKDIIVLHVAPIVSWTSYMVLVTSFSRPQMQAMMFKVGKLAQGRFNKPLPYTKQNAQGKEWECMDFGEVVVQVMTAESREFYDLESFYAEAEEVELPFETETLVNSSRGGWKKKLY